MIAFGVGELSGCFFIGFIIDKYGNKTATITIEVILCITMTATFGFLVAYEFGAWAYIMCFMWGLSDSTVNTHV